MKSEKVINEEEKGAGEPRGAQDAPRGGSEQGQTEIPFILRYRWLEVEGIAIFPSEDCEDWEVDVYYIHPETGQRQESLHQCHFGWSFQESSQEEDWQALERLHAEDDLFLRKVWEGYEDGEDPVIVDYTLEEVR